MQMSVTKSNACTFRGKSNTTYTKHKRIHQLVIYIIKIDVKTSSYHQKELMF